VAGEDWLDSAKVRGLMPNVSYILTVALGIGLTAWVLTRKSHRVAPVLPSHPDMRAGILDGSLMAEGPEDGSCAVMDWSVGKASITLVCFSDGTTSIYWASGGGIIGAGTNGSVEATAARFRALLSQARLTQQLSTVPALPPRDYVAFHLVSPAGRLTSGLLTPGRYLRPPFEAVFLAAQDTITAIRHVYATKSGGSAV